MGKFLQQHGGVVSLWPQQPGAVKPQWAALAAQGCCSHLQANPASHQVKEKVPGSCVHMARTSDLQSLVLLGRNGSY